MPKKISTENKDSPLWQFDESHDTVLAEAHARPSLPVPTPSRLLHFAFRSQSGEAITLFETDKISKVPARNRVGTLGSVRYKLERHMEFYTCTFEADGKPDRSVLIAAADKLLPFDDVEVMAILDILVVSSSRDLVKLLPFGDRVYGGRMRDFMDVRSTIAPDDEGVMPIVVRAKTASTDELGRRLQRLIEAETYRVMCLLGLPLSRRLSPQIGALEDKVLSLNHELQQVESTLENDQKLFSALSELSLEANTMRGETRFRFSASHAYFKLVQQRLDSLEEKSAGEVQTLSGFVRSRLEPAMATIVSTSDRLDTVTEDISRALVLLRTRVELHLNKGNQQLLQSMNARHLQQVKIAQAVEGLSAVAITYYSVGLLSYVTKAFTKQPWFPLSQGLTSALLVPLVFMGVWMFLRRMRDHWDENH